MIDILVVDDEVQACKNVRSFLEKKGYRVAEAHDGIDALAYFEKEEISKEISLVILDLKMPKMNGFEALQQIKDKYPATEVIIITALGDLQLAVKCMQKGAFCYLTKPVNLANLEVEIKKAFEKQRLSTKSIDYQKNLEEQVAEKTLEVRNVYTQLEYNFFAFIRIFVDILEHYDTFIGTHCKRVGILAERTGRKFGLGDKTLQELEIAGLLHDIGLIKIPRKIQYTPMKQLNQTEISLVKSQTVLAQETLKQVDRLNRVGWIIRSHLERFDGTGFPDGLKGKEIPLESRIISVVNAYDEMKCRHRFSSGKVFTNRSEEEIALDHLKEFSGTRFDPEVVQRLNVVLVEMKLSQREKLLVPLQYLEEGMTIAEDISAANGELLVHKGSILSSVQIETLCHYLETSAPISGEVYVYTDQTQNTKDTKNASDSHDNKT
ncbi:MAG: response regulator [Nitrospirae bacterium]|nr:response regulator [Nitrospirota bacterium]